MLYVIACPTGPSFRVARMLSLKAVNEHVRAWPGGTGGYKLAGNYAPTFMPQAEAAKEGYDQVLWCLEDNITEAGAMNFFAVLKRDDGGASNRPSYITYAPLTNPWIILQTSMW